MKNVVTTIIYLLMFSFSTTFSQQALSSIVPDYYVSSKSGSDKNDGLTKATAWQTISKVNSSLPPNKIVAFQRGTTYTDKITPISGATYTAYGTGNKPKFGNSSSTGDFFNITVDGVTINNLEIESTRWVTIQNADNLTINECYFHHYVAFGAFEADASHSSNIPLYINNSDYFILRNSTIEGNYYSAYQDMIYVIGSSQFSLIEGNYIQGGAHQSLYFAGSFSSATDKTYDDSSPHHIVVRNNHFYNHGHHNLATNVGAWMFLVEGNYFERAGTGIDSATNYNKYTDDNGNVQGSSLGSAMYPFGNGIIRNNIIRRAGVVNSETYVSNRAVFGQSYYAGSRRSEAFDQAIYNNVFWDNWGEGFRTGVYLHVDYGYPDNLKYENISFVNNAFGGSKNPTNEDLYIYKANTSQDYLGEYRNNSFEKPMIRYGAGRYTAMTITDFNTSPPGNITAKDNLHIAPNFVSPYLIPNDGDVSAAFSFFEPQPNSQLIDTGDFLTFTVNSGSNDNKIKVLDSKFFMDGWGIVDGDNIQLGNEIVKIISIDHGSNILTVNKNISWDKNIGVSLPYSGSKPDIGAVELNGNTSKNSSSYFTPIITEQPTTETVSLGSSVSTSVAAICSDEIGYQWWKYPFVSVTESKISNSLKFSGATTNTLTINNVDYNDNESKYVCEVYNTKDPSNRWVNSEITTLIVSSNSIDANVKLPIIISQPKSISVIENNNITFSIEATCEDEIGYQWWRSPFVSETESKITNNSKFSGATTNQLTIKDAQNTDANISYVCEVYNKLDRTNLKLYSDIVGLTVLNNNNSSSISELKVFLEGPFNPNGMLTILNKKDFLPIVQPFNFSPFNYSLYQKVEIFPDNIVDWILIELRSDASTITNQFATLLRNDGLVLNTFGVQNFSNHSIEDGEYYLVIHHRNHLSIMSKNKISIKNSVINYNFTTSVDQAYGTNSMIELENGYFAMYSGNGDANNIINKLDFGSVANNILSTGYELGDIDMNGIINVLDYSNINKNISVKSNVP